MSKQTENKTASFYNRLDDFKWYLRSLTAEGKTLTGGQIDYIVKQCQSVIDLAESLK